MTRAPLASAVACALLLFANAARAQDAGNETASSSPPPAAEMPSSSSPPPSSIEAPTPSPAPAIRAALGELTDAQVDERLAFIQSRFDRGTPGLNRWWFFWIAAYGTLSIGEGVVALAVNDHATQFGSIVGGASSLIGLAIVLLLPPSGRTAAWRMRRDTSAGGTDRREQLRRAEHSLRQAAADNAFTRSWLAHTAGVLIPAIGALILWLGFNLPASAALNFFAGVPISEAQILSTPTAAIEDQREYLRRFGASSDGARAATPSSIQVRAYPGGVSIAF